MSDQKGASFFWKYIQWVFAISWLFWSSIVLLGLRINQMPAPLLFAVAGAAPMLAALWMVYRSPDQAQRADFWNRLIDLKRLGWRWGLLCLLLPFAILIFAGWLDRLAGGTGAEVEARFLAAPLSLVPAAIFLFFFGPLPEELGWRGFALEALQRSFKPLVSSLILGFYWALWHLPLFFIEGSYQQSLLSQPLLALLFPLNIFSQTFLMTWIYNRTRRSTLSAVLFHFAVNLGGELLALSLNAEGISAALWAAAALAVLFFGKFNQP